MRSVPGLLSVFLIAAGVACAELPPDLPPASPLPFAPGPVIGGTIKGNPAAGIVPVKDLIEAMKKEKLHLKDEAYAMIMAYKKEHNL